MTKRKRYRTAHVIPEGRGTWAVVHRGETVLSGVDRRTALFWASHKGLRVRIVRLAGSEV